MWFVAIVRCRTKAPSRRRCSPGSRAATRGGWRRRRDGREHPRSPTVESGADVADTVVGDRPNGLPVALDQVAAHYADDWPTRRRRTPTNSKTTRSSRRCAARRGPTARRRLHAAVASGPGALCLRLEGGGALVFVDLVRTDSYHVAGGHTLSFEGTEAGRSVQADGDKRAASPTGTRSCLLPADGQVLRPRPVRRHRRRHRPLTARGQVAARGVRFPLRGRTGHASGSVGTSDGQE